MVFLKRRDNLILNNKNKKAKNLNILRFFVDDFWFIDLESKFKTQNQV